ncbi:Putative signal transducing protein [Modicisalibacter ilicicola DSM 19980]|uniref:Putative signal transducing protein n=1 Tax=Modicisalibacter ilicicola DSM 19980 TaxID=1121942 RepID=A0A1M4V822_9GAMM|nr:Putative signal transducing protein [Halomonas ilicicola DSM 19980]
MAYVRVFRHSNTLLVGHVRNLLESAGIPCELHNMTLGGGAGELPLGECEPEVWVAVHNRARAEGLINEALDGPREPTQAWCCPHCGERLEGVFDTCWRCAANRPD